MARTDCDLPEPLSPTIASFSRPMEKDMSRTTWEMPVGVRKRIFRFSTCSRGLLWVLFCIIASLLARIEDVAQPVADQVEAEADDENGDAGEGRDPPLVQQMLAAAGDHGAPFRLRWLRAEAEEA